VQSNVADSAGILAGLVLKRDFINQMLRRELMQQSVIYQEWREELLQEGRKEGEQAGEARLILRQLNRRFGSLPSTIEAQVQALTLPQIEALGEALLDFAQLSDLTAWLESDRTSV
jgi:predicted transposase YdaD